MKRIIAFIITLNTLVDMSGQQKDSVRKDSFLMLEPVEIRAVRASDDAPFTKTMVSKKEIEKLNLAQDLPFILNQTPSVVVNSDAGNGVGYTGIRIRGTDASRINITLNGIPFNDAESQGTFFVDLPDFSSSISNIQVQRGVGTSSNGAGAFGASINISTNDVNEKPYLEINNSFGSFNTWKHTVKTGSGIVRDHLSMDLRLSKISSDGYIDRATSDLKSFYFSTAWLNKRSSLRFNAFSGKEKTYQAWYGVSEFDLPDNRTINYAGTEKPGDPYNNETDNYQQDHYQFFYNQELNPRLKINLSLFYVKGSGYYEQYKYDQAYSDYGLKEPRFGSVVITNTDLVRQLWLDNDFYGNIFSFYLENEKTQLTGGGGWNFYKGKHFGNVIWAEKGLSLPALWYDLDADKKDLNFYVKQQTLIIPSLYFFYDLQYRSVKYDIDGFRNNPGLFVHNNYRFFNPKIGFSYRKKDWSAYLSYSRGQKEPNRDDFEAGAEQSPEPEKLDDMEASVSLKKEHYHVEITGYYMYYTDQLVLTGKINDVGAYTRTNIPDSYRSGIEIAGGVKLNSWLDLSANLCFSRNKIRNFTEYLDDYDNGGQQTKFYSLPDIAFSPGITGGAIINISPVKNGELSLISKYVGRQYLDNTQNGSRKLDAFFVQDARVIYTINKKCLREMNLVFQVNNLLNKLYEPNGYTFSYFYGGQLLTENYYYPMAGRNFMIGINLNL